jgi:DNA-binding NarL/FixJ family response regulator
MRAGSGRLIAIWSGIGSPIGGTAGLEASRIRVLVAEDYEPWRRFVLSALHKFSELQVICEVADGLEAVQKAIELRPDLILLDIGLPTLSGIEAARQIRERAPSSKIIFLTEDRSPEAAEEALRLGASGYVVKSDAGGELLSALNAVLEGKRFTSSSLADYALLDEGKPAAGPRNNVIELTQRRAEIASRHDVTFYSDDQLFLNELAQFVAGALKSGSSAVIAATDSHREGLLSRLRIHDLNIGAAIEQRRYIAVDAAHALSTFMVNSMPDRGLFMKTFGNLVHSAAKASKSGNSHVSVFGECMHLICAEGNAEAAIRMEDFGSELTRTHDADVLCGYFTGHSHPGMESHIYQRICAAHSSVHSW